MFLSLVINLELPDWNKNSYARRSLSWRAELTESLIVLITIFYCLNLYNLRDRIWLLLKPNQIEWSLFKTRFAIPEFGNCWVLTYRIPLPSSLKYIYPTLKWYTLLFSFFLHEIIHLNNLNAPERKVVFHIKWQSRGERYSLPYFKQWPGELYTQEHRFSTTCVHLNRANSFFKMYKIYLVMLHTRVGKSKSHFGERHF